MPELPRPSYVHVLWARSDRYPEPQFVAAWPDGLVDAWHEWYLALRAEAIRAWVDFDDGGADEAPWTFWMEGAQLARPAEVGEPIEVPADA